MFDFTKLDEEGFRRCTFNDIKPEDLIHVEQTFNDYLDGHLRARQVTDIRFDGCDDVAIICDDGHTAKADSQTTMKEIIEQLVS